MRDYAQKWVCLICGNYYDSEKDAKKCSESHSEIEIEPYYTIGHTLPSRLLVRRKKGEEVIETKIYVPE